MQLSKRLAAVARLVSAGSRLADVGTDHGYVPISLVCEGKIPSAIAMDVNRGPLNRARAHIKAQGLEKYIDTRLSDGLAALAPGEADSVLIAGMGGMLMMRILSQGQAHWDTVREWILQPQSEIGGVRHFLAEAGFRITDEDMVKEDGKYYPMFRAVRGNTDYETEREFLFGKALLDQKHPILKEWLGKENQTVQRVLETLNTQHPEGARSRQRELEQYHREIQEALSVYEM